MNNCSDIQMIGTAKSFPNFLEVNRSLVKLGLEIYVGITNLSDLQIMMEDSSEFRYEDKSCKSFYIFMEYSYPPWEILYRIVLFILSGMNVFLIHVSHKKQRENWDTTR